MSETQSQEEFEHLHGDGVKNLELEEARLALARSAFDLQTLDNDLQATLGSVHKRLAGEMKSGAEAVFAEALKSLNEVEAKRFVIQNVLEALKNGQKVNEVLDRYGAMGLVSAAPTNAEVEDHPLRTTQALLERKSLWERVTTAVAQIGVNALRTVPKWVEIEPSIGFVGPIPTVSFALKGKGMTVSQLFEALRGAQSPLPLSHG